MTRSILILILLTSLTTSCGDSTKSFVFNHPIDIQTVASAEILKVTEPRDTIKTFWKALNQEQIESFVDKWNRLKDEEPVKYLPTFKITIHLKNDSIRTFRASGNFIKERNDWCVNFGDSDYFEKLYSAATLTGNR